MKCILSLRVARHLLAKGFRLIDVEPSRKINGHLVFIFEATPELLEELAKQGK
ncbi:DUF5659 domain-containing protein [Bacillus sp. AFS001701]|uniref:DUF5659 domain-containing protein n=1 Tax=Bacillus sp. AFS001701 TaxID=2033480 RepID=UPI001596DC23|nr:DUF5659 domain-containing protein [Bacillus sp. AFS001701]